MPPAARVTDMHTCPMVTPPGIPHVGGPILPPCAPTVLIGFLPAARVTDMCLCVGPPDVIVKGSPTVLINNLLAARIGDQTAHGGVIVLGCPTVIIGEQGAGSPVSSSPGVGVTASSASPSGGGGGDAAAAVGASDSAPPPPEPELPTDPGPLAKAFNDAAANGTALVCKGPCEACGHA